MTKLGSPAKPVQPFDIPALVASIAGSVIGPWPLGSPETIAANLLAAVYQDADAHDTCSLTACLNPLHPGPCKGWKGTLFDTAPGAWHSLEAAKVEKANATRVKKIEALKQAGKPIPHKLLQPIVAKPHPHAGQTANKATGEAHEAGKAVTQNAGVHPNAPGKVTLGQASKTLGPVEKGPKGKKPTLGSKGIAFVIAQDKVTPQYKLDKAAAITPEQWAGLSEADKSTIRGELAKISINGFGPQQEKANTLLAKLPAGGPAKVPTAAEKAHAANAAFHKQQAAEAAKAAPFGDILAKAKADGPLGGQPKLSPLQQAMLDKVKAGEKLTNNASQPGGVNLSSLQALYNKGVIGYDDEAGHYVPDPSMKMGSTKVQDVKAEIAKYKLDKAADVAKMQDAIGKASDRAAEEHAKATNRNAPTPTSAPEAPKPAATLGDTSKLKAAEDKVAAAKAAVEAHRAKPKLTETYTPKPKPQPKHVQDAIAMAEGKAPGATWSKNHLAAYQTLSADEFHALPKDVQGKIVSELEKGKSKFLDPKKIAAAHTLLAKFGHGEGPKAEAPKPAEAPKEPIGFAKNLHDHSVTQAQAKKVVEQTPISAHFAAAKQTAGLNGTDNPDSSLIGADAQAAAEKAVDQLTALVYDDTKILDDPAVKAAVEHLAKTAYDLKYAQTVNEAKAHAYNKISLTLSKDDGKLSPIEKASLQHYQKHLLSHPVKTDTATLDKLQKDAAAAHTDLGDKLKAATKTANAPKAEDMTPAQIADRVIELLGKSATEPHAVLSLADLTEAKKTGQEMAAKAAAGMYAPEVMTDPSVASKYAALESALTQTTAWKNTIAKLDTHIGDEHHAALGKGVDVHGNPLSLDDKKVIEKHAEILKADHDHLYQALAAQQAKVVPAAVAFTGAATKAQGNLKPAEPHKLTSYDESAISDAYQVAWSKHAVSAVSHGLKTYVQKQKMKDHPDYPALTQNLGDLKVLAGKLAVAHAEETTAKLNIPAEPDTGLMDLKSPEWKAWQQRIDATEALTTQFNGLHKQAQVKLDTIRTAVGLNKRALPKLDTAAVKAAAAESGYYKTVSPGGPNYGKSASAKSYMLAKVGPTIGVAHQTAAEKKAGKLGSTPSPPAPSAFSPKIENVPKGEPVKLGGDSPIAHIPASLKKTITADFKGMPKGVYLADPAEDVFGNLVNLAAAHGKAVPGGLSVDQVLKTIDETHSKKLGVSNSGMLHKKITDWLATPAGKSYAEANSTPKPSVVKQLAGELDLPNGITLAPGEKVQKLAGPGAHDASLDAKAFKPLTSLDAQQAQDAWMKANGVKWTEAQKKSIKTYTGSTYTTYNSYLRGEGAGAFATKQAVINIQSAMHPLPQHTLLKRGTGWPPELAAYQSDPHKLMGKTFEDKAFVSTTVAGSSGHFSSQPLQLTIEAPAGTPAAFINGISHFEGTENEMLLAAGTKFKVLSVETKNGKTHMRVRIVGDK
jgi:hypothetical protein